MMYRTRLAGKDEQLVGPVERREHRPVEERRRVDHDRLIRAASHLEQARHLSLRHELGVLWTQGRREDVDAGGMLCDVPGELLRVELARRDDEVVDRLLRLETEDD
jgi:hypothetical protein